jgi:hypothetical protein
VSARVKELQVKVKSSHFLQMAQSRFEVRLFAFSFSFAKTKPINQQLSSLHSTAASLLTPVFL